MVETITPSAESIYEILSRINDPEVPAISIVDLGIVRSVRWERETVVVTITPTYSGCPAMRMIEEEIRSELGDAGYHSVSIETVLTPAWTTDWMSDHAKEKLQRYGIAPPQSAAVSPLLQIALPEIACPLCRSHNTQLKSEFGSTACKSYYYCFSCHQPFEYFKPF